MKRTRALLTTAIPVALLAALALTGCSAGSGDTQQACAPSGAASESLKIDGDFGAALKISSTLPIEATSLERSVLISGNGDAIAEGDTANANFTVFNGKSGDVISPATPISVTNKSGTLADWAAKAVGCAKIGDRVATVMPVADVLGAGGGATYNLADTDSLVAVFDFLNIMPTRAQGTPVDPPAGFPSVSLGDDGNPTITIPQDQQPPTETQIATLIKGAGDTVQDGDTVTVQYRGVIWRTGQEFDASWTKGAPVSFPTSGVIPGFTKALVGQTVGSQVIAVIPPADGYGDSTATKISGAQNDDVLVFVIDILSTAPAAK